MAPRRLPVGTQVVAREAVHDLDGTLRDAGSVGVVKSLDGDAEPAYRVEYPDNRVGVYTREQLIVRAEAQWMPPPLPQAELWDRVVLSTVIGSQAYGLATDASDIDRRGAYLAPPALDWSLRGAPEQLEHDELQACYWELKKLITLALKANPNALECLYSPMVERITPVGEELRAIRSAFLSNVVYATYNGYALSQFKKLNADRRLHPETNWKHAMHLLRALQAGITALREGHLPLDVGERRDALLAIRRGEMSWAEVERWRLSLHREFDCAVAESSLPDLPDYRTVERFLVRVRRRAVLDETADPAAPTGP